MILLLASLASASTFGFSGGAASLSGLDGDAHWVSVAPMVHADMTWRVLIFEGFSGLSASALLASDGGSARLENLLNLELGGGLGTRAVSVGVFVGLGLPNGTSGVYARGSLPTPVGRMGLEARMHGTTDDASGFALMFRVEPSDPPRARRQPAPEVAPPAPPATPPVEPEPVEPEPADPPPAHHDDPY